MRHETRDFATETVAEIARLRFSLRKGVRSGTLSQLLQPWLRLPRQTGGSIAATRVLICSPYRAQGPGPSPRGERGHDLALWLLVRRGLAGRAPPSPSCRRSRRWVLSQAGGPARESRRQPATGSARGSQLKRPRRPGPRVGPATQVSLAGPRRDTPKPVPARPRPHRAFVRRFRSVGRLPISLAVADRAGLRVTPLRVAGRRELSASRPASPAACLRQARPGLAWPGLAHTQESALTPFLRF